MSLLNPVFLEDPTNKWIATTASKILAARIKDPGDDGDIPEDIKELGDTFLNSAVHAIVQEWVDGKTRQPLIRKTSLSVSHLYCQLQEKREQEKERF